MNGEKVTELVIPNSVESIGDYAFEYCSYLTNVIIPDNVISIGKEAFCYCTKLTSVTIGESVTSVGNAAFANCRSLTEIICLNTVAPSMGGFYSLPQNGVLKVPSGSDYSSWMSTAKYYLGYYNWTIEYI